MPASRSARAMILAPRSCPSSPGLATTTRILRLPLAFMRARILVTSPPSGARGRRLEDRGLGVGAEHRLERLDDLALGRMRTRRLQQRRHEVGAAGRLVAQSG